MDQKTQELQIFSQKFKVLKEKEKEIFSRIVNKLFQVNYLTSQKNSDLNDYRFILLHQEMFISFLKLIDFELEIQKHDEVIFIKNIQQLNKLRIKKEESLLLFLFRILFQKKKELVPLNHKVEIYLQDIYLELKSIGYTEMHKLTKEKIKNSLLLFKQYNIIDFSDYNHYLPNDLIIRIYPTILYLINLGMLQYYQELFTTNVTN
ncbi:MAG: DUF4194 domain-containing protein [Candidatus Phytoplasma australasiaticum]|nr:DUF4194 domain-containing protein [Candidatus Phytoplasma australasiaticum]